MISLLPQKLTERMMMMMLSIITLIQVIAFFLLMDERRYDAVFQQRMMSMERIAHIVKISQTMDVESLQRVVRLLTSDALRLELCTKPLIEQGRDPETGLDRQLSKIMADLGYRNQDVRVQVIKPLGMWHRLHADLGYLTPPQGPREISPAPVPPDLRWREKWSEIPGFVAALQLESAQGAKVWLNVVQFQKTEDWHQPWNLMMLVFLVMTVVAVTVGLHRAMRPLREVGEAVTRVGEGEDFKPIPEQGPAEIRQLIRSFNQSHNKIQDFLKNRTHTLMAIGHDLKTPLTILRLRVEMLRDGEAQAKILDVVNQLQQMVDETLHYARSIANVEPSRRVDMAQLLESMVQDQQAMGHDIRLQTLEQNTLYACKAVAMKRALGNVIDNAIKYGGRCRVVIRRQGSELQIVVEDHGPGIPKEHRGDVLEPFVRLEPSRSRNTGGVGLGLTIARDIIAAHGGTITLRERTQESQGLQVVVSLPET